MKKKILFVMLVCAMICTAAITGLMLSGTSYAVAQDVIPLEAALEEYEAVRTGDDLPIEPLSMWTPAQQAEIDNLNRRATGWEARAEMLTRNPLPANRTPLYSVHNGRPGSGPPFRVAVHHPITSIIPQELFMHPA